MNNSLTEKTIFQTSKASAENTTGNLFGIANKNCDTDWLINYYGGSTKSCYIGGKGSLYSIFFSIRSSR